MILGVGVDLLSLPRLRSLTSRRGADRLAARILSSAERKDLDSLRLSKDWSDVKEHLYLGTRWAAKEAAYKAVFPVCKPTWKQLRVTKTEGKPQLSVVDSLNDIRSERGGAQLGRVDLHLSISHDADLVIALVVAEHRETIRE